MKPETVVFAGHFTVCEKPNAEQFAQIEDALQYDANLAMVVNDIDLKRRLFTYHIRGEEGLISHYEGRGKRKCGRIQELCSIPKDIKEVVDWDFYKSFANQFMELNRVEQDVILREKIVPKLIEERIHEYGLDSSQVQIYTERQLRNYSMRRMRNRNKHKPQSWFGQLKQTGLTSEVKTDLVPVCGGIMLALYEKITGQGYNKMIQLYSQGDKGPIENGLRLNKILHEAFPEDPRWSLEFENKFYSTE